VGVAVGLGVADVLVRMIGVGAAQIGIVAALAMEAAVFFGERTLLVNQAAISAILVVVLQPPDAPFSPDRFFNALVGGGVALAISHHRWHPVAAGSSESADKPGVRPAAALWEALTRPSYRPRPRDRQLLPSTGSPAATHAFFPSTYFRTLV
jgi:hypothetical protein